MTANYGIVNRLGESIVFEELGKEIKASLKGSTNATYSLANRAYYIEGQAFKGKYCVGDYFRRKCERENVYMVSTINSEPLAQDLVYLFAMRCNAVITIMRYKGRQNDEYGDVKDIFEEVYKDIPVYRDFTTRSGKQTNDGLIDQAIYTLVLPHRFMLSEKDRIIMKTNIGGEYADRAYYVENIGNALAEYGGEGIDTVQLSLDTRS
ncbi:MAG: hypothetical protein ACI4YB_02010 [Oscillospiraceae bacterium]